MQENCLFGSEGGAKLSFVPTPIQFISLCFFFEEKVVTYFQNYFTKNETRNFLEAFYADNPTIPAKKLLYSWKEANGFPLYSYWVDPKDGAFRSLQKVRHQRAGRAEF
jgi:hypothetical protein